MRLAAILAAIGVLTIVFFALGPNFLYPDEPVPVESRVHYYRNPSVSLNNVHLEVFYVLPEGNIPMPGWRESVDRSLKEMARFHSVQFLGKSLLTYDVAEIPLAIARSSGPAAALEENPELLRLSETAAPQKTERPDSYVIRLFIAEGNGMGATPESALVPAKLFREDSYEAVKESIIYHALGRALGMPNGEDGVMGAGMFRAIGSNFIEPEIVQKMGLLN